MTFDEAIESSKSDYIYDDNSQGLWTGVLEDLKKEYAPTIEMTKSQKMLFLELFDGSDIGKDVWGQMINDEYPELPKLSYRESIITYLHPETIKVAGE